MAEHKFIPFSLPRVGRLTEEIVARALKAGSLHGDGPFTQEVSAQLGNLLGNSVLLTHSGTAALEMSVLLAGIGPGDEVIVPDYTFSSTASAVAIRGGVPVFVDVDAETLNISLSACREALTERTKAIIPVHYGGVPADMDGLTGLIAGRKIALIEDAAQAFGVRYHGKPLGTLGDFGCISFHATKNLQSGEGGALLCKLPSDFSRAEMVREKGTDRSAFLRGEVDKYTWRELGSSYLPSDLIAAYLLAQIIDWEDEKERRLKLWQYYKDSLQGHLDANSAQIVSGEIGQLGNGHIFALILGSAEKRREFILHMKEKGIGVASHYVPLHSSPAGKKYGRVSGELGNSISAGDGLVRLPMHVQMETEEKERVVDGVLSFRFT